jgi:hypothetical protein
LAVQIVTISILIYNPAIRPDMSFESIVQRVMGKKNIEYSPWKPKPWDPDHVADSLQQMLEYAEQNAQKAIDWYWDKKRWKAISSRTFRLAAILLTAISALIPIIGSTGLFGKEGQQSMWTLRINQAGYAALGLAALALALDRFLSASTSWMRYVTTATAIQTAVEKFQLDWDKVTAPLAGKTPAGQDLLALINRIEEFSTTVRVLVENETNAWVAEFQANLAELQKSTAAAVETARAQVQAAQQKADADQQAAAQKAVADQQADQQKAEAAKQAARPGGIDLTIENAGDTDQGYEVLVDGQSKKAGVLSSSCGVLGISPGLHDLQVQATIGGIAAHVSQLVTIAAGAATKVQLVLAKQKAKGA